MTTQEQYRVFIETLQTRKRRPVKGATIAAYESYWKNWIQPHLGSRDLAEIENGVMRKFVATLAAANLSPASIAGITGCLKLIISSAVDENGNEVYPRKWNNDFIDAPILDPQAQKAPALTSQQVTEAISSAPNTYAPLFALLAASGLRIGEAMALKAGPDPSSSYWDPRQSKIVIRKALFRGEEQSPKTAAGIREIDLAPQVNDYLLECEMPQNGFLFANSIGGAVAQRTLYDAKNKIGLPGFHAFRRFRITHLENMGVPLGLINFWAGHAGKSVHDRYVKLNKDVDARKEWAAKAGLGFELPSRITNRDSDSLIDEHIDCHSQGTDREQMGRVPR